MPEDKAPGVGRRHASQKSYFKKGQSPNPDGRPKGSINRNTIIRKVLSEQVSAELGGRKRKISVTEASLRKLAVEALKGDLKAIRDVLQLWKETEDAMNATLEAKYPFSDIDRQMIGEIHARMSACKPDFKP